MIISAELAFELKDLLERHERESDCHRTGGCCSDLLIEFLDEMLSDLE